MILDSTSDSKHILFFLQCFPLQLSRLFHLLVVGGIFFWTGIHLLTHFASFALDGRNVSLAKSSREHFRESLVTNLCPMITGLVILTVFVAMTLSSCIGVIRKQLRFIPFHVLHWGGAAVVYLLLVVHGINYYNPSFWKWLLPLVVFVALDKLYWIYLTDRFTVGVKNAGPYDDISRVAIVEMDKPSGFKFEVGQYIMLRIPWIGEYQASMCLCLKILPHHSCCKLPHPFDNLNFTL